MEQCSIFTTVNAQPGGVRKLPAGDGGQGGVPAFLPSGSTERHRYSYQYFKSYAYEYSKHKGVKQVTFITIFIRLVILFLMTKGG
jgi:hypothetical protein